MMKSSVADKLPNTWFMMMKKMAPTLSRRGKRDMPHDWKQLFACTHSHSHSHTYAHTCTPISEAIDIVLELEVDHSHHE